MRPSLFAVLLIGLTGAKATAMDQAGASPGPSFFSAYAPAVKPAGAQIAVRCRLSRAVSNLERTITLIGIVQQDLVASNGKIIVPAGSKVIGEGYCDAALNRIMARKTWSLYVSDHLIRMPATMLDSRNSEGLENSGIADLNVPAVRQAIYRDGAYVSVKAASDFVLRFTGNVSIEELKPVR